MTGVEARLRRDVSAVTGGVLVTEAEVRAARAELAARVARDQDRSRQRRTVAVLTAAVVVPLVGYALAQGMQGGEVSPDRGPDAASGPVAEPAPPRSEAWLEGSTPTPGVVRGIWRLDNSVVTVQLTAGGRIALDDDGTLLRDPDVVGTYTLAGDTITVEVEGGADGCAGQGFAVRAATLPGGLMRWQGDPSAFADCPFPGVGFWAFEQLAPTAEMYTRGGGYVPRSGPFAPIRSERYFLGDWVSSEGGHVLEMGDDGTFSVADGSGEVVDEGRWTFGSELVLTSTAASAACDAGDVVSVGDVRSIDPGTPMFRGALERDTCGAGWAADAWFHIPDSTRGTTP